MKNHRSFFLSFILIFSYSFVSGQSISQITNSGAPSTLASAFSVGSLWFGAQVSYFNGQSKEFTDNTTTSGNALYYIPLSDSIATKSKFFLPVQGNFSEIVRNLSDNDKKEIVKNAKFEELILGNKGINIGLFPYYKSINREYFGLDLHGGLSWKLNGFKDTISNNVNYLNQGRIFLGADISIGKRDDGRRFVLFSVAPTFTIFGKNDYKKIFGEEKSLISTLDLIAVIPIAKGIGVLFEDNIPLSKNQNNLFRVGLIFTAETTAE